MSLLISPSPEQRCPKRMVYGPCGGVRPDRSCEMAPQQPCPFAQSAEPVAWVSDGSTPTAGVSSKLLELTGARPVVITDLTLPAFDADALADITKILAPATDAVLVGEHQNRPDFPPTLMASLIRQAGGVPWLTLTCRDRNRLVLEQELAGLRVAGADGVLCVTGDGRAQGVRPGVTQVFDLDGTRLTALAAAHGLAVAVPEAPDAEPVGLRPGRLAQKQHAGARLAILNHVGSVAALGEFVRRARAAGVSIPIIAAVAVYTDRRSASVLQNFPGLHLDPAAVAAVLSADDPERAGIQAAVREAQQVLAIEGISGVNLSGLGSALGERHGAHVKAEVGRRILAG